MPKQKNKSSLIESLNSYNYYLNITKKSEVYLDMYKVVQSETSFSYRVSPETLVILRTLYECFDFDNVFSEWINVNMLFVPESVMGSGTCVVVNFGNESRKLFQVLTMSDIKEREIGHDNFDFITSCARPSVVVNQNSHTIISGLSSTLRFMFKLISVKDSNFDLKYGNLLGFRGGCLQACAESSIWTKFCEVDMMKRMIKNLADCSPHSTAKSILPEDLLRLEYHLSQPVKIHNFQKWIKNDERNTYTNLVRNPGLDNIIRSTLHKNEGTMNHIPHDFAEGPDMTLADLILFPAVDLALRHFGPSVFGSYLPTVMSWMSRVAHLLKSGSILSCRLDVHNNSNSSSLVTTDDQPGILRLELPVIPRESLYKSDTRRFNPKLRIFTKQEDIDESLKVLSDAGISLINPEEADTSLDLDELLDWSKIPAAAQPGADGGQLPESRREKKNQQLANLVQKVQFLYSVYKDRGFLSDKLRIVDFCSGGGHLGILIGYLFPDTKVLLVENKEESLRRARERVKVLSLTNISFVQCNLTNFNGSFEIGVGLHACGSATDLILSKCSKVNASFVVCPCCYGGIQCDTENLAYPRSETFRHAAGLTLDKYLVLAHSADQTHDEAHKKTSQGRVTMRAVDTDRLKAFDEDCYQTWLQRIIPCTASPKNHILIGLAP